MADKDTKLPVKKESSTPLSTGFFDWHPFDSCHDALRRQVDRLFEEFPPRRSITEFEPFERFVAGSPAAPPVDIVEKEKEYE
jgi:HSP20 family protein